ncbi:MAG: type II toxin-antitoxin system VapC family toxin [Verrucomicrobia bacterium]|nr:type II toxin-antitoxin system VapC family toxin [Verrucomicrobiota bacterium]
MGVKDLKARLASLRTVLLDTVVFAYHLADHPQYSPLTTAVLAAVESGSLMGVVTTITLSELLAQPARAGNRRAVQEYELFLTHFPHLHLAPVDVELGRETALVRGETGLRMPDALQIAAGRLHGVDAIVTNDSRWRERVARPEVILLDDYLGSDDGK